jgi:hypothetical protein
MTATHSHKIETFTATAPSYWASYLINGDASGLEYPEIAQADAFLARQGGYVVSCEDYGFCTRHDAWWECPYAVDCQEYTFIARP